MISWPAAARKSAACFAACVASGEISEPIGEAVHRAILAVVFRCVCHSARGRHCGYHVGHKITLWCLIEIVNAKSIEAPCQPRQPSGPTGMEPRLGFKPIKPLKEAEFGWSHRHR